MFHYDSNRASSLVRKNFIICELIFGILTVVVLNKLNLSTEELTRQTVVAVICLANIGFCMAILENYTYRFLKDLPFILSLTTGIDCYIIMSSFNIMHSTVKNILVSILILLGLHVIVFVIGKLLKLIFTFNPDDIYMIG